MPPPSNFADYPEPIEGPAAIYKEAPANNPSLRGYPLLIAGNLIANVGALQKLLWGNAGFGDIKDIPELDDVPYRFTPGVTPLGDQKMLDFEPELLTAKGLSNGAKYYTAADYHQMYKSGKVAPLQVASTLLPLTKKGPYADAWADTYGKDSLALEAARASTERYAAGRPLGVLDGVPVGVKDDIDVKGYVSHIGMKYKPGLPCFKEQEKTMWLIEKLQEAGAVVIGKNRMHEMGSDTTGLNVAQGTPTNHHNKSYYPGGSTSGGASALGAGFVPIVVGSDAGGSIRIPSSFNGVYGLQPSHNRTGFFEGLTMAVRGPLATSVADLTVAYRIMSQPNPDCPVQSRFGTSVPPAPDAKRVIGIYRDWWAEADPRVAAICDKAVEHFSSKRGYEVIEISIPFISESRVSHGLLCVSEMAAKARRKTPNPADWLTLVGPANKLLLSVGQHTGAGDYIKANAMREVMMRHLAHLFRKHPGLLIVTPTTPLNGWPRVPGDETHGLSDTNLTVRNMMYIFLANLCGTPAVTAPVGYAEPDRGEGKIPVGLMAMGEWGAEEQLLGWAREAEEYLHDTYEGGRKRPETWFDVLEEAQKVKES